MIQRKKRRMAKMPKVVIRFFSSLISLQLLQMKQETKQSQLSVLLGILLGIIIEYFPLFQLNSFMWSWSLAKVEQ